MTNEELSKLTPEQKRIKIAEACGWYDFGTTAPERGSLLPRVIGRNKECMDRRIIPDYLNSLDAMHEAERQWHDGGLVASQQWNLYERKLCSLCAKSGDSPMFATATQRVAAFLLSV